MNELQAIYGGIYTDLTERGYENLCRGIYENAYGWHPKGTYSPPASAYGSGLPPAKPTAQPPPKPKAKVR